ncbi:hypothetical protein AKJ64_01575 [candidate division MSBL1 archaeon SCGC-AAA259E17]|uniref:Uncharacterized protein n=1 Tax=candidate division MSBL1 archaeon SCGC-AAA259E17 TaxID=1698263 RepID=A0A133UFM2_9EURY|nr:hypothetical protein AKJ64_01575 [candidate division MSBL1 archaeon SCGC-AAA259E17]
MGLLDCLTPSGKLVYRDEDPAYEDYGKLDERGQHHHVLEFSAEGEGELHVLMAHPTTKGSWSYFYCIDV